MTIKRSTTGFGLNRLGDGVAASFYEGILVDFFGGGVNTQSDAVACNDIPSACIRLCGNEATLPARGSRIFPPPPPGWMTRGIVGGLGSEM